MVSILLRRTRLDTYLWPRWLQCRNHDVVILIKGEETVLPTVQTGFLGIFIRVGAPPSPHSKPPSTPSVRLEMTRAKCVRETAGSKDMANMDANDSDKPFVRWEEVLPSQGSIYTHLVHP